MKFSDLSGASAIAAGIAYIVGLLFLGLFFAGNDSFGAMSDRWIIVTVLLFLPLILGLYRANKTHHPATSLLALILGLDAVAVSSLGSYLFVTGQISFRESLLPGMG